MNALNTEQIKAMLREGESINVDFKKVLFPEDSPKPRKTLNRELVKDLAAFANTEGGYLFIGVDNDGTVTGFTMTGTVPKVSICEICRGMMWWPWSVKVRLY